MTLRPSNRRLICAALGFGFGGYLAAGDTIATFADPAANGSTPLFAFVSGPPGSGSLSGGWTGVGLNLLTPGLAAPDFANARFLMNPVSASGSGNNWALGAGSINFSDSGGNALFSIQFNSGQLTTPNGFGASDFIGQGVTFSGPIIPGGLTDETFAFSFANQVGTPENYTATAAFTSSAVPEPVSMILLAVGGMLALRRRM